MKIVAHRGASGDHPEHTRAAFEAAIAGGADAIECDVRLTKDQHLVCLHDRTVDRTSDGSGAVSDLTLEQLREFDFGSWHPRGCPQSVVTLDELLDLTSGAERDVGLFVETKHPVRFGALVEQKLLATLHRHGAGSDDAGPQDGVVVISFSGSALWRVRRNAPTMTTVLLGEASYLLGGGGAVAVKASAIGPSIKSVRENPDTVAKAAAADRKTYCWTVDDADDVRLCEELGVDWIATNFPARTRSYLSNPTQV